MVVYEKTRKRAPRTKSEAFEQKLFFRWLSAYFPEERRVCFAIPNGGSRDILEAANLKRQGVTAGVPDVFLAVPKGRYHGLFIEFKYGKNKLTKLQSEMGERLKKNGYHVVVCYSFFEASGIVRSYLSC